MSGIMTHPSCGALTQNVSSQSCCFETDHIAIMTCWKNLKAADVGHCFTCNRETKENTNCCNLTGFSEKKLQRLEKTVGKLINNML